MKFFTNKKFLFKLVAAICICLTLINFCAIPKVQAESLVTKAGGKLLDPICDLALIIGDGIMQVFQTTIMGEDATIMYDNTAESWLTKAGKGLWFAAVFAAVCVATGFVGSFVACIPLIGSAISAGLTSGVVTFGLSVLAYSGISGVFLPEVVVLPTYYIGPEEIFSGKILLFDTNIFKTKTLYVNVEKRDKNGELVIEFGDGGYIKVYKSLMTDTDILKVSKKSGLNVNEEEYKKADIPVDGKRIDVTGLSFTWNGMKCTYDSDTGIWSGSGDGRGIKATSSSTGTVSKGVPVELDKWNAKDKNGEYSEPLRKEGYEPISYFYYKDGDSTNKSDENIVQTSANYTVLELKETIAKWYFAIRNIALIALILILLYIGIRMLTSSIASEKSKYKQMLSDWVISLCLVFLMQYIMVFANEFVEAVNAILVATSDNNGHVSVIQDAPEKLINAIGTETEREGQKVVQDGNIYWPTNLMGRMRILAQEKDGTTSYIGYVVCFSVLLIFTICFVLTYLKRLLYLLFLTVIAPFVAMTYPLDKIRDGNAQAFNLWFKEYIYNLMIQPFHLMLYTIFVSMAFELAGTNIIYSLVVLGFMMPAEKFLRNMFGFNKASTPGFLEGATGAAMTMTALHSLSKFAGKGPGGNKRINDKGGNNTEKDGAEYLNRGASRSVQELLGQIPNSNSTISTQGQNSQQANSQNYMTLREQQQGEQNGRNTQINNNMSQQNSQLNRTRMLENPENSEIMQLREELDNADYNDMYLNPEYYNEKQNRLEELENENQQQQNNYRIQQEEGERIQTEIQQPNLTRKIPKPTFGELVSAGASSMARDMKRDIKNVNKKKVLKNVAKSAKNGLKFGSKLTLGGIGAIAGVSAGIASGDINSVIKNTSAGVVAGSAIGAGVANRVIDKSENVAASVKNMKEEAMKEALGSDYSEYKKQQKDKKFIKDKEMRNLYARELGLNTEKEIDKAMNQAIEYRENGVEDNDVIIKAMTMDNGYENNRADKIRIAAAKLSMQSKTSKDYEQTIKMLKKNQYLDSQTVEKMDKYIKDINKDIVS